MTVQIPSEPLPDLGPELLKRIHKSVLIDEPWTEWGEREFAWIGYRLRQIVAAEKPYNDDGIVLTRITSRLVLVEEVAADFTGVESFLADVNRFAVGSGYFLDREARQVKSFLAGRVHEGTAEWRPRQIDAFLACQIGQAESEVEFLAYWTDGKPAYRTHPISNRRESRDEIIDFIDAVFGARGEEPSKYANAFEFETIAEIAEKGNTATLGSSKEGICIEVPFGDDTSLITFRSDWLHPRIGSGLRVTVELPPSYSTDEIGRMAGALNRAEAGGEYPYQSFGGWGAIRHRQTGGSYLGHTFFLPNAIHTNGATLDAFYGAVNRARWANRTLNPNHEEGNAWEIMLARTKALQDEITSSGSN